MKSTYDEGKRDSGKQATPVTSAQEDPTDSISGRGVTERNRNRIWERVSESGLFDELTSIIETKFDELVQKRSKSRAGIVAGVLDSIKADLSTMMAPKPAILTKYPVFARSVTRMIKSAKETLEMLQDETKEANDWAKELEYI